MRSVVATKEMIQILKVITTPMMWMMSARATVETPIKRSSVAGSVLGGCGEALTRVIAMESST